MGFVGVGGEVDGSSNKIGAGFCGVIDFDHEVVVGVVVLEIRIVWIELLVLDHVDTAPTRYVAAFGEGCVAAGGSWWGAGGAWREAVPACIFAVLTPAAAEACTLISKPVAIGAIAAVFWAVLGSFLETV